MKKDIEPILLKLITVHKNRKFYSQKTVLNLEILSRGSMTLLEYKGWEDWKAKGMNRLSEGSLEVNFKQHK